MHRSGDDAGEYRREHAKDQHWAIQRDLARPRREMRKEIDEQRLRKDREGDTHARGEQPEQRALCQQLPQQTRSAGADGGSQRQLVLAVGHAGQREVRHIGAPDRQDECCRGEKNPDRPPRLACDFLSEQVGVGDVSRRRHIGVGILSLYATGDHAEIVVGLPDGHARLQPRERAEPAPGDVGLR